MIVDIIVLVAIMLFTIGNVMLIDKNEHANAIINISIAVTLVGIVIAIIKLATDSI